MNKVVIEWKTYLLTDKEYETLKEVVKRKLWTDTDKLVLALITGGLLGGWIDALIGNDSILDWLGLWALLGGFISLFDDL